MEGILALLIPVLALATGLVATIKRPARRPEVHAAPESLALAEEVAQLRLELAEMRERVDFTERLLSAPATPAPRVAPAYARIPAAPLVPGL